MFASTITSVLAVTATLLGAVAATPISATGAIEAAAGDKRAALTSGKFTWYNPGLGACGQTHTDADLVVALSRKSSHFFFSLHSTRWPTSAPALLLQAFPNTPLCGKKNLNH
jgi:hypothetical protein